MLRREEMARWGEMDIWGKTNKEVKWVVEATSAVRLKGDSSN